MFLVCDLFVACLSFCFAPRGVLLPLFSCCVVVLIVLCLLRFFMICTLFIVGIYCVGLFLLILLLCGWCLIIGLFYYD